MTKGQVLDQINTTWKMVKDYWPEDVDNDELLQQVQDLVDYATEAQDQIDQVVASAQEVKNALE
jgi:ABC-type transporter Mla subunit MlaD